MNRRSFLRRSAFALALLLPWKRDGEAQVVEEKEDTVSVYTHWFANGNQLYLSLSTEDPRRRLSGADFRNVTTDSFQVDQSYWKTI